MYSQGESLGRVSAEVAVTPCAAVLGEYAIKFAYSFPKSLKASGLGICAEEDLLREQMLDAGEMSHD